MTDLERTIKEFLTLAADKLDALKEQAEALEEHEDRTEAQETKLDFIVGLIEQLENAIAAVEDISL